MHKITQLPHQKRESRNLLITVVLNLIIAVAELIGGILSNSLALISDALHNFGDGIAVLITYITVKISGTEANAKKTFGYKRIQILAALFNALTLIAICVFLLAEAWHRFREPQEVEGFTMLFVASIGLIANLVGVWLLKDFSAKNLNIKAAYLHLIGDTLSSVAVIVGGVFIWLYQVYWLDPLITALISVYIIRETWHIVTDTYNILMQAAPPNMDIQQISENVKALQGVSNMHHVHLWCLTDQDIHLEAHIELENNMLVSDAQQIQSAIEQLLKSKFGISHITLQIEYRNCVPSYSHKAKNC